MQILIGFLLGIIIALLSWRLGALSSSGALAAAVTGGLIFGLGGFAWAVLLLVFFISSSGLSRAFAQRKTGLSEKYSKGSRRDAGQVIANGGVGALLAILHALLPGQLWVWAAYASTMAAVNADTWATELGVLNKTPPRLITSGTVVEQGTSGAISLIGTISAFAGAGLLGLFAAFFTTPFHQALVVFVLATLAGFVGSLFDSFLGATVQAIYYCPKCKKETERHPLHTCGTETVQRRGWRWLDNDLVNIACSLVGAVLATGAWILFS